MHFRASIPNGGEEDGEIRKKNKEKVSHNVDQCGVAFSMTNQTKNVDDKGKE